MTRFWSPYQKLDAMDGLGELACAGTAASGGRNWRAREPSASGGKERAPQTPEAERGRGKERQRERERPWQVEIAAYLESLTSSSPANGQRQQAPPPHHLPSTPATPFPSSRHPLSPPDPAAGQRLGSNPAPLLLCYVHQVTIKTVLEKRREKSKWEYNLYYLGNHQMKIGVSMQFPGMCVHYTLEVMESDTVYNVKAKIKGNALGLPIDMQRIEYNDKQLVDGCTLKDQFIQDGAQLVVRVRSQILVKRLTGQLIEFLIDDHFSDTTIYSLKEKIHVKIGLALHLQRLIYNGKWLEDARTLADYNICPYESTTIRLALKLPGG